MINPNSVNTLAEGYELQIATLKQQLEEYQDRLAKALGILDADCQFEAESNLHILKQQNSEFLKDGELWREHEAKKKALIERGFLRSSLR